MRKCFALTCAILLFALALNNASAIAADNSAEDQYITSRDSAIKRLNKNKPGTIDDAATRAEELARADLETQMRAILGQPTYAGFSPSKLNLDTLFTGDQGFGILDGLRFDASTGMHGEPVGARRADGSFVEPRSHIVVTTKTLLARWLSAHPDLRITRKNDLSHNFRNQVFYTRAISTDAAVYKFVSLPMAKPLSSTAAYAILASRSQSEMPDVADEIFASVLADEHVFVVYGSLERSVRASSCLERRAAYMRRLEQSRIDADTVRHRGEREFTNCFALQAATLPEAATLLKQAETLIKVVLGK